MTDKDSMIISSGLGLKLNNDPIATIDKEYFTLKFEQVFHKWEANLWVGMTPEDQKEMLKQIIGCLNE